MDRDEAIWLAELLLEAISNVDDHPGLTLEVEGSAAHWVQVLFEQAEDDSTFSGFTLNFPCRQHKGDPLAVFQAVGLKPPPDTRAQDWEDGGFATVWLRPDVPVVALALFIGDILERVVGAQPGASLAAQLEYGF